MKTTKVRLAAIKPGDTVYVRSKTGVGLGWYKITSRRMSPDRESLMLIYNDSITFTWYISRDCWDELTELKMI